MGVSRIIVVIMIQCLRGDRMEFKDQLYKYRKEKGYSQEELAMLCHVSRQAISKWENGTANPDMENLKILSKALSVNIDTLLGNRTTKRNYKRNTLYIWMAERISFFYPYCRNSSCTYQCGKRTKT